MISTEQLDRLHQFTREHFVAYYEVELELVDHLAQGIEFQWQQDDSLSFEAALAAEFKKFGIYGFSDLEAKMEAAWIKMYYKKSFAELKAFFKLPKVMLTAAIVLTFYKILSLLDAVWLEFLIYGLASVVLFYFVSGWIRVYQLNNRTGLQRKYLYERVLVHLEFWPYYLILLALFQVTPRVHSGATWSLFGFAAALSVSLIYIYVLKAKIVPQLKSDFMARQSQWRATGRVE